MVDTSSLVVSINSLHADNGVGVVQQVRGEQAKVEFRPTVFSKPPYLTESRILSVNELRTVKSPLVRLRDCVFDEPWRFELLTRAAQLLVCNRDGQLSDARTDLLPHQISIAHRVVSSPQRRFLIADEVGLGKTIETGMILYALRQQGLARRVLIIPPAGLTLQWQEELEDKFGLKYYVYREDVDGLAAFDQDNLIASIDTLKLDKPLKGGRRDGHKTLLLGAQNWDVIIFDEAHKLSAKTWSAQKIDKTLNYKLAEELQDRCRSLILLTGTPHQGDESKFQNLISLLHDNISFDELGERDSEFGPVPYTELVLRNRKSKVTDADGNPIFKGMEIHPVRVNPLSSGEKLFHKKLENYLRDGYGFADQDPGDRQHKAIGFVMTTFQKLAASSTRSIKKALEKRLNTLNKDMENRQNEREEEFDARHQGEYEERQAANIKEAFIETEVEMIKELLDMKVPEDAKQEELLEIIRSVSKDETNQRVLIFTEYLATQVFIIEMLEAEYGDGCTTIIKGGMSLWDKKKSMSEFRDNFRVRFMVSTEAGGEGINLQFAHIMINYDLPWNPFRLAQRYGRLYRYGQDKVVQVFNFQNAGTIEDRVRANLEKKTRSAASRLSKVTNESVVEIEEGLLGLFDEYLDYEKIYREGLAKGDIKPSLEEIDQGIKKAEQAYKIAYDSLFSKDIAPFNPDRFKDDIQSPMTLVDVENFIVSFLRNNGRKVLKQDDETIEFIVPECLKDVKGLEKRYSRVTFNRTKAIRHSEYEFMALGHPFTNAVIQYCGSVDFNGFSAYKKLKNLELSGVSGVLFNFTIKITKKSVSGETVFFEVDSIFVKKNGVINEIAKDAAINSESDVAGDSESVLSLNLDANSLYDIAFQKVLENYAEYQVWEEDIQSLCNAVIEFE
ncbi:MAG: DEAD/DEAH box helicase [Candidatus Electryonea clarkiae]|nr:DEAD/DEAH box helicase [Candidatus Electryonea clarkiae]MDP8288767.1 DEAD/DEAH box helicase [Candidatus Electryonea clarkiae]